VPSSVSLNRKRPIVADWPIVSTWRSKNRRGHAAVLRRSYEFLGLPLHFTSRNSGNICSPKSELAVSSQIAFSFDEMKFVNDDRSLIGIRTESPFNDVC
jgi:hypothetical protein